MSAKRLALEFEDVEHYREALRLLDGAAGEWALPGLMAIIIETRDLRLFEEAGLSFKRVPVIPAPRLSAAERAHARTGKA